MFYSSSHSRCVIQRVQVSYVAHVTPIPENLDSHEAASFLCAVRTSCCLIPWRILTITCAGCHRIPRVKVQQYKSRRLDRTSWSWRWPRTSWFAPRSIITSSISPSRSFSYSICRPCIWTASRSRWSVILVFDTTSACFLLYCGFQTPALKRKRCV